MRDVLAQTVQDFEFPKGRRTGEPHRNVGLAEARGRIVCYHADDDLWLPHHLEQMLTLLRDADFAQALTLRVHPDGNKEVLVVDIGQPEFRRLLVGGSSRIHLSGAGHTMELFRRLPDGWRETPPGIPTDHYMWKHILEQPGVRAVSGHRATVVVFPTPQRRSWSLEERVAEIRGWSARLSDPAFALEVQSWAFSAICVSWLETYREAERRADVLRSVHESAAALQRQVEDKQRRIEGLAARRRRSPALRMKNGRSARRPYGRGGARPRTAA